MNKRRFYSPPYTEIEVKILYKKTWVHGSFNHLESILILSYSFCQQRPGREKSLWDLYSHVRVNAFIWISRNDIISIPVKKGAPNSQ